MAPFVGMVVALVTYVPCGREGVSVGRTSLNVAETGWSDRCGGLVQIWILKVDVDRGRSEDC
jgi:hypothetical protein